MRRRTVVGCTLLALVACGGRTTADGDGDQEGGGGVEVPLATGGSRTSSGGARPSTAGAEASGGREGVGGRGANGGVGGTAGAAPDEPEPFITTSCAESGDATFAAFSNDGRYFAYQQWAAPYPLVLLDRQTGIEAELLAESDQGNAPILSGDATRVAWQVGTGNESEARVVDVATGASVAALSLGDSFQAVLSHDGRFLAYGTRGPAGTSPEPYWQGGIAVRDLGTDTAWLASVTNDGASADDYAYAPDVSDDGRFAVFQSVASNLVPGKPGHRWDAYLHDHTTGATRLVAPDATGGYALRRTWHPRISGDGSVVAALFLPTQQGEEPAVTTDDLCFFTPSGEELGCITARGDGGALEITDLSSDGRFVLFSTGDDAVAPGDANGEYNAVVYDRGRDRFELVAHDDTTHFSSASSAVAFSGDGDVVAFKTSRLADSATVLCFAERGGELGGGGSGGAAGAGGAGGAAGGGGAGGALVDADFAGLLGHYTLTFAEPLARAGCATAVYDGAEWLDVALPRDGTVDILLFGSSMQTLDLDPHELVIREERYYSGEVHYPELRLAVASGELTGVGVARVPYRCGATEVIHEVPVLVTREDDEPRLVPRYSFPGASIPGGGLFTFGSRALQLPYSGGMTIDTTLRDPEQGEALIAALDATTGAPVPLAWQGWPWGPAAAASFAAPAPLPGTEVEFTLLQPLTSYIGTAATMDARTFTIVDAGEPTSLIDFDAGPHPGAHGTVTYFAPGAPDSPCESGGCLALDGPVRACSDWSELGPGAMLAMRLNVPLDHRLALRYRIYGTQDSAPELWFWEASACNGEENQTRTLAPLTTPAGVFTHASAWIDGSTLLCMGPSDDKHYVLAPGCSDQDPPPISRIVIERVAVVPP